MKRISLLSVLAAALVWPSLAKNPFAGRWDIVVTPQGNKQGATPYPDWMELVEKEGGATVRIQPRSGGAREIKDFKLAGSHLSLNPAAPDAKAPASASSTWELDVKGDKLTGAQKRGDTTVAELAGVRAPKLDRKPPKAWADPEPLFNGKDLTGWEPIGAANHWVARDGELVNEEHGANIMTTRKFDDFKLHIEYNCPDEGNSGVYLRGRYEVQVEYEKVDANDKFHSMGSIYSFIAPAVELPRKPGTWESYDITLVGRHVTIVRNGIKTVDNQEIPGITGGALDCDEGEPGPFYIQGDHTGGMKYRNITISVPKQ
jgi:Domain of Unknown Function (DUF1080)